MKKKAIANILLSMRASIDACLFILQEKGEDIADKNKCEHPLEHRVNLTTMGAKKEVWKCSLCGEFLDTEDD